jgi:hypothetical protein
MLENIQLQETEVGNFNVCMDCGAFAPEGDKIKHHDTCIPGESEKWEKFYEDNPEDKKEGIIVSEKITKEEFDKEVNAYKGTPFYTKKSEGYKAGFADALFLAWQIVDEHGKEGS